VCAKYCNGERTFKLLRSRPTWYRHLQDADDDEKEGLRLAKFSDAFVMSVAPVPSASASSNNSKRPGESDDYSDAVPHKRCRLENMMPEVRVLSCWIYIWIVTELSPDCRYKKKHVLLCPIVLSSIVRRNRLCNASESLTWVPWAVLVSTARVGSNQPLYEYEYELTINIVPSLKLITATCRWLLRKNTTESRYAYHTVGFFN